MRTICRSLIPEDYIYYRTGSKVFFEYYRQYTNFLIQKITHNYEFVIIKRFFGSTFGVVIAEKIDVEPTKNFLHTIGLSHGIMYWTPLRKLVKPAGWFRIPTFFPKDVLHASRSAFSILDRADYWNKWSRSARAHRRKILELKSQGVLEVIRCHNLEIFLDAYSSACVKDPNYTWLVQWCVDTFSNSNIKNHLLAYVVKINGKILAGAVFIEQGVTSEYFTSFYTQEAKPYHLGIAIMNAWFSDSYQKGMKYLDLDHMQDEGQLSSYAGYTKFKESIADHDVYFHDMWVKFF